MRSLTSSWAQYGETSAFAVRSAFQGEAVLDEAVAMIKEALTNGRKIFFAGNGGSAADSLHLAAEFVGRFRAERRPLPAISLAADIAAVTAIGNDYGFAEVFARQIQALGMPGDILVVISTSAQSPNIIEAARRARTLGIKTIAFVGRVAHSLEEHCDIIIKVDSEVTSHIQEAHKAVGHAICQRLEEVLGLA